MYTVAMLAVLYESSKTVAYIQDVRLVRINIKTMHAISTTLIVENMARIRLKIFIHAARRRLTGMEG